MVEQLAREVGHPDHGYLVYGGTPRPQSRPDVSPESQPTPAGGVEAHSMNDPGTNAHEFVHWMCSAQSSMAGERGLDMDAPANTTEFPKNLRSCGGHGRDRAGLPGPHPTPASYRYILYRGTAILTRPSTDYQVPQPFALSSIEGRYYPGEGCHGPSLGYTRLMPESISCPFERLRPTISEN